MRWPKTDVGDSPVSCRGFLLCTFVFGILLSAQAVCGATGPVREINVGVAVSAQFKSHPEWKRIFLKRLAYASQIFDREFKIRFWPTVFWDWETDAERQDMDYLIEDLMSRYPLVETDAVIGLTRYVHRQSLSVGGRPRSPKDRHALARARPFSGYMVLRYPDTTLFRVQEETMLVHELGHLFGAVHTHRRDSIMAPVVGAQIPTSFDEENRNLISLTRNIDFHKGTEALNQQVLATFLDSYRRLIKTQQTYGFYHDLGTFYLKLQQPEEALGAWKAALNLESENTRTLYNLGMVTHELGRREEAVKYLARAVEKFRLPSETRYKALALHALGNTAYAEGHYDAAYSYWTRSEAARPGELANQIHLAILQMKRGRHDHARRELERLLERNPRHATLLSSLGAVALYQGKYAEAIAFLKRSYRAAGPQRKTGWLTELDGGEPSEILRRLGLAEGHLGGGLREVEYLEKSAELNPTVSTYKRLGEAFYRRSDWSGVERIFGGMLKHAPDDPYIYRLLSSALMQQGKTEKALYVLGEGLDHVSGGKEEAEFHRRIGDLYRQEHEWKKAIAEYRKAVATDWQNKEAHLGLAYSFVGLSGREDDRARRSLQNVLAIDPANRQAKELLAKL